MIPEKVKIGYKDYEVKQVDGIVVDGNSVCYGVIRYNDGIIEISKSYSKDLQECSLIHEIIHGVDDIFNLGLEEKIVEQLAKGLYQVIKDNPEIFK